MGFTGLGPAQESVFGLFGRRVFPLDKVFQQECLVQRRQIKTACGFLHCGGVMPGLGSQPTYGVAQGFAFREE